jgi:iron-sulfur-dependent L-serine dehydratase single chain form
MRCSGKHEIAFDEKRDLVMNKRQKLPYHTNGMRFSAFDARRNELATRDYYSVGGGFVVNHDEAAEDRIVADTTPLPYPFTSGDELLAQCAEAGLSIAGVMRANERAWRSEAEIRAGCARSGRRCRPAWPAASARTACCPAACKVARRAPSLHAPRAASKPEAAMRDPLTVLDWVNLYALAVNEENAAGGRVVTAPTNGAAGIVPAVLHYYDRFCPGANDEGVFDFLLTAGAIGILYKENASISGAEVGCQGEVGVACSMAAAGLAAALGGTIYQVENAAEIGMEHNLGLTCDPIGGLVQIPCIERNAMGAVKAINAARMAAARRRQAQGLARQGDQDHARHRPRHAGQVQGNLARRPRGQRDRVLTFQSALACSQPAADLAVFLDGANDVFATLQSRQAGCRRTRTTGAASSTVPAASGRNCAPGRCNWKGSAGCSPAPPKRSTVRPSCASRRTPRQPGRRMCARRRRSAPPLMFR